MIHLRNIFSNRMVTDFLSNCGLLVPGGTGTYFKIPYLIYQVLSGSLLFYERQEEITKKFYVELENEK
jgi:hypothetical protein